MHGFRLSNRIDSFDAWLDAATRRLCADAKDRVSEEIESHYLDALAEARAGGYAENVAIAMALESLGDATRARRKFFSEHLTVREARIVEKFVNNEKRYLRTHDGEKIDGFPHTLFALGLAVWMAVLWLISPVIRAHEGHSASIATLAVFVLVALVLMLGPLFFLFALGKRVSRRLHPNGKIPLWRAVQLEGAKGMFFAAFFVSSFRNSMASPYSPLKRVTGEWLGWVGLGYVGLASLVVFVMVCALAQLRLAQKLRRLGFDEPPSAMA